MTGVAFYVVDGTDGSGKSTVSGMLRDVLESSGRSVCLVEHPNNGWLPGRAVSALLLRESPVSRLLITFLFFADLIHSVFRMKCASDYDDFIFVRYTMSVCHLPDPFCGLLRRCLSIFFMKPDLAIFVDIPADTAMGRIEERGGRREIFENRRDLEASRARMRTMADEEGWAVLDNSSCIDDVHASLCSVLSIRGFNKN